MDNCFKSFNTQIYNGDVLNIDNFSANNFDLTITSPPYNVGIEYNANDDTISYKEYLNFSRKWMENIFYWTKDSGRLCLNIALDKNKGGQKSIGADITTIAQNVGWLYHSTVIWNEGNISKRTAWGSWLSASAPYVIAPVELIIILYKGQWKKKNKGVNDITKNEFMEWTNGIWTFNGEKKIKIGHPAPFPRELPRRCIKLFSYVGNKVFDPFLGSGTTLIETSENNRIGVGLDISKEYCELAKKRIISNQNIFNSNSILTTNILNTNY